MHIIIRIHLHSRNAACIQKTAVQTFCHPAIFLRDMERPLYTVRSQLSCVEKRPPVLELYPCVQVPLSRRNYYNPEHTIVHNSFLIMDNLLSIIGVLAMLTIKMLILNVIRCGLYLRVDELGVACHLCNFLEYDCVMYGLCCILAPGERSVILA